MNPKVWLVGWGVNQGLSGRTMKKMLRGAVIFSLFFFMYKN